jgi:O-succinylhomoserine sulfhydrylase
MAQMGSGGTVLSFDLGSREAAFAFLDALEIVIISNNLGDAKSIATHPASTTHQRLPAEQKARLGIAPGLIRLSCGIEDTNDLVDDVRMAIEAANLSRSGRDAAE